MNSALEYSNKNPPLGGFLVDKCLSAFAALWRDGRIIIFVIARECNDRGNPVCLALLFTGLPRCARNDKKELVDNDVFLLE